MTRRPRKPTLPSVRPPSQWSGSAKLLCDLHHDFGTLGHDIDKERDNFLTNIRSELMVGIDHSRFADIYDWRDYNLDRLIDRNNEWRQIKPKIDFTVRFTTKGNLVFEWEPSGWGYRETDWRRWRRIEPIGGRPSNELIFLRQFEYLISAIQFPHHAWGESYDRASVAMVLLAATYRLFKETKRMLEHGFDVTLINEIAMETTNVEGSRMLVTDWRIQSVAEREEREELAELAALPEKAGITIEQFVDAW